VFASTSILHPEVAAVIRRVFLFRYVFRELLSNVVFEESCSGDDFGLSCTGL
jgi:hypothetical protein